MILAWTPAAGARIIDGVRKGNYLETAAAHGGVTPLTARNWVRIGCEELRRREAGQEPRPDLDGIVAWARDYLAAVAGGESTLVERINEASLDEWKAAAWLLERRFPERWRQQIALRVEEQIAAKLKALEAALPADVFSTILDVLAGAGDEGRGPDPDDAA